MAERGGRERPHTAVNPLAHPLRALAREVALWRQERTKPHYALAPTAPDSELPPYPVDMRPLLDLPFGAPDAAGVLYNAATDRHPAAYQPTSIAQYALAAWNAYLECGQDRHREAFLTQAEWLLAHEQRLAENVGGWPIPFAHPQYNAPGPWLSALTQGNIVSVFVRAYLMTQRVVFLEAARRALRPFELDILDGGVCAPIGRDGIFFEEVAVYPAAHILNSSILALIGLYDYVAVTGDRAISGLIDRCVVTLHTVLDAYDAGYWSRYDVLHGGLAPLFYHALHVTLLEVLARYTGCAHCRALAARWAMHLRRRRSRLRYFFASRAERLRRGLLIGLRRVVFRSRTQTASGAASGPMMVGIPITAFPVAGGMRGVLSWVAQAADDWQMEYVTRAVGPGAEAYTIRRFGGRLASPWHFPSVWLYVLAGRRRLLQRLRQAPAYRVLLPQDGVFTAAFTVLAARLAGVRVVCMDHGTVTWPFSRAYHTERLAALRSRAWFVRLPQRLLLAGYWRSLRQLARLVARRADLFLVAGDEVEEVFREELRVHPARIRRYRYAVDLQRYASARPAASARRSALGVADGGVVITMINRLTTGKGLEAALPALRLLLDQLDERARQAVRVIIAGAGPLEGWVRTELERLELTGNCLLWGEASPDDVVTLLGASDVFLYAGTRGTNYSMAVLEAMASGCAVVATTQPRSNAELLADRRGVAVPAEDVQAMTEALVRLAGDAELRAGMGRAAQAYVAAFHSAESLRRTLRQATYYAPTYANADTEQLVSTAAVGCSVRRDQQTGAD